MAAKFAPLLALAAFASATPINVSERAPKTLSLMSMGASISDGYKSSDGNGYRDQLTKDLKADGTTPTYVGREHSGSYDTESTPGFVISQVDSDFITKKAYELHPQVILINVGNNNCVAKTTDAEVVSAVTNGGKDYAKLLSDIKTYLPSTTVFVSNLLVSGDATHEKCNVKMSGAIYQAADNATAGGQKIVKVDLHSVLNASELQDGTHPTDAGYDKVGNAWYKSLKANGF